MAPKLMINTYIIIICMYTKNHIDLIIMRGKPTHQSFGLLGTLVHEFHIKDVQKSIYFKHHLIPISPPSIIL